MLHLKKLIFLRYLWPCIFLLAFFFVPFDLLSVVDIFISTSYVRLRRLYVRTDLYCEVYFYVLVWVATNHSSSSLGPNPRQNKVVFSTLLLAVLGQFVKSLRALYIV